jgi:hypothetical protein
MSSPINYAFDAFVAILQQEDARDRLLALVNDPNFVGLNVAPPVLNSQNTPAKASLAAAPAPTLPLTEALGAPDLSEMFAGPDDSGIPDTAPDSPVLSDSSDDMVWDDWKEDFVPKYEKDVEQHPVIPLDQSFTDGPYRAAIEYEQHKIRKQEKREISGNRKRKRMADPEEPEDQVLHPARKQAKTVSRSFEPDDEMREAAEILLQFSRGAPLPNVEPDHGTPAMLRAPGYQVDDEPKEPRRARTKITSRRIEKPASKPARRTTKTARRPNMPQAQEQNANEWRRGIESEQQPWQPPPEVKNQRLNERITLHPSKKQLAAVPPPRVEPYLFAATQAQAPWKRKEESKIPHHGLTETTAGRKRKSPKEVAQPTRRSKRLKQNVEPGHEDKGSPAFKPAGPLVSIEKKRGGRQLLAIFRVGTANLARLVR